MQSGEWWRTVRYAIGAENRTGRLIGILVTVGVIVITAIVTMSGVTVTVG
jgi:hypothetical protein